MISLWVIVPVGGFLPANYRQLYGAGKSVALAVAFVTVDIATVLYNLWNQININQHYFSIE